MRERTDLYPGFCGIASRTVDVPYVIGGVLHTQGMAKGFHVSRGKATTTQGHLFTKTFSSGIYVLSSPEKLRKSFLFHIYSTLMFNTTTSPSFEVGSN